MQYTVKITSNHDMSDDEQMRTIDVFDGTHDAALLEPRSIEILGARADSSLIFEAVKLLNRGGYQVEVFCMSRN